MLTDFGIAQFEGDPRLTQTGMVMGSPGFTAPERIRGSDASPASDLWSLGATIYAAVEGRGPYEQRGGAITTMSAIINEDAPIAPHAGKLAPVIAALLRRDPTTRPSASAAARMFAQALPQLSEATEEPPSMSHPPTIRSKYVPSPAAPVASAPVTAPDDAKAVRKPAPVAAEQPAADVAAEEEVAEAAAQAPVGRRKPPRNRPRRSMRIPLKRPKRQTPSMPPRPSQSPRLKPRQSPRPRPRSLRPVPRRPPRSRCRKRCPPSAAAAESKAAAAAPRRASPPRRKHVPAPLRP